jgi:hypothetical protein
MIVLHDLLDHVVVLAIPNELDLDAVAVACEYGLEMSELLKEHPVGENLVANLISLSETGLPAMI